MKYKFSIIIPVYNAEKTICRCLDSLLKQNNGRAEIILVNDGSKDRSGEICREYARKNDCVVYIEQENAGASSARNTGLSAATGTYITFVDSDDYVLDGYFDVLDAGSDDDFVVFSYHTIRSDDSCGYQFSRELLNAENHTERILTLLRDRIASPWNKCFKRSVIEENHLRFKKDLIIGEDFIFGLEYMLLSGSSRVVDEELYCVDETGMDSITRAAKYDFSQFVRIYGYAFEIAKACGWDKADKERLIRFLDYLYCRTAFASTGHWLKARGNANVAIRELIPMFQQQRDQSIRPLNKAHAVMQFCVDHRLVWVFVAIAWLRLTLTRE